jgi:cytochrome c oxidase subunit 2
VVEDRETFDNWLDGYPTYQQVIDRPAPNSAAGQAGYAVCAACHGAQGEGNAILNAPKLTGQSDWYLERQILNFKHGIRGTDPADTFGAQMAPMAATLANDAAIRDVVAYISSLPDTPAEATIEGNAERGKDIFITCSSCHGAGGEGIWALKAPRLKGGNDWYIARQLENYRSGARGSHPDDLNGKQMKLMTSVLRDDQSIRDLVAYINTL